MIKKEISLLFLIMLFSSIISFNEQVKADDGGEYEKFLSKRSFYSKVINYVRAEKKKIKTNELNYNKLAVVSAIDLLLSGFCLWLATLCVTWKKNIEIKQYFWFFFILNVAYFIFLIFSSVIWKILDFLVIKLRSDLAAAMVDNFSIVFMVIFVILYIWLLARTFSLDFIDNIKVFLISQLFYFLITFSFSFIAIDNQPMKFIKGNFGYQQSIRTYINDVDKITSGKNILIFIRFRVYHI